LPPERTLVINRSGSSWEKLREIPYKVFGWDPNFFRRIEDFGPVLLHAHFGPAALTALPIARHLRIPLITTFHGYDATVEASQARNFHYTFRSYTKKRRLLQREGALFIAVSRFIEEKLVEQGFSQGKIVQHYIGVDTDFFCPSAVRRDPIVLFAARLTEKKGCGYLIAAMAEVQRHLRDVELIVIGDGPLKNELEQQAKRTVRGASFLGVQSSEEIRRWMQRARVFCVPSVRARNGDAEGFGIVFIEAQAMQLPVVSFRSGGVPEAVAHGETGLLAGERNVEELARHLVRLLTDQALWDRMSKAGRERVLRQFDLRKQTAKLEDLYDRVLGRTPQAAPLPTHSEVMA
jgi:glycosyltransferase involved in cell wall biosynthesis